ncbi:MAG: GNAT family N-acetyltransferase, partial [Alphaproteobacteria bacterium]|nr:GNAT family N-acetyltransferase [Alphaproteobacteria bacterium]
IRLLQPDDAEAYRAIRLEALEHSPEAFGSMFEVEVTYPLDYFAERLRSNAVFGAWRDGTLLGMAGFRRENGPKYGHKGALWGVYVKPAGRGTGTARALIERLIEHARTQVELIELVVVRTNEPARRLYASLGFTEYGLEKQALKHAGVYYDLRLMVKFF